MSDEDNKDIVGLVIMALGMVSFTLAYVILN
jgi:hypothetical protein